jgi:hypothetical protein
VFQWNRWSNGTGAIKTGKQAIDNILRCSNVPRVFSIKGHRKWVSYGILFLGRLLPQARVQIMKSKSNQVKISTCLSGF